MGKSLVEVVDEVLGLITVFDIVTDRVGFNVIPALEYTEREGIHIYLGRYCYFGLKTE